MRRKLTLIVVAAAILTLSAGPAFAYCQQECRLSSSGETMCALGLLMVDCAVVSDCIWQQDCPTCDGHWSCQDHCEGDRCLRA